MTQAANLGALGTNVSSSGIAQAAGGGTAGTAGTANFKNRLINGSMLVWQRSTSFTTGGNQLYGSVDRWATNTGASITLAQSSDVPTGFIYSLSVTGTSFPGITQKIESLNCADLVGQPITVSFYAKKTAGTEPLYLNIAFANAKDDFSATTTIVEPLISSTPSSSWTRYSYTLSSVPAGGANGLRVIPFIITTSNSNTMLYTGVQLEVGTAATNFDVRSFNTELMLCQRYFSTSFPYGTAPVQNSGLYTWVVTLLTSGYGMYSQHRYPVPMRITATTITGYNGGAANNLVRNIPAGIDITNLGINPTSTTGFNIICYGGGGDAGLPPVGWNWAASAEL
jgi:hypothetical protein